ncbi:MAG: VOC family protein [Gaiellaceae bacterium]
MTRIVHFEIPVDDTEKSRAFWGGLFGWQFESYPGPSEYHMTRIDEQSGAAISTEPGKRGQRVDPALLEVKAPGYEEREPIFLSAAEVETSGVTGRLLTRRDSTSPDRPARFRLIQAPRAALLSSLLRQHRARTTPKRVVKLAIASATKHLETRHFQ